MRVGSIAAVAAVVVAISAPAAAADFQIAPGASSGRFFGASIGLALHDAVLHAAWADNSAELGGNPDPPALDIGFAGAGGTANLTGLPLSQGSPSLAVNPVDPQNLVLAALDSPSGETPTALRGFTRDGGATWTLVRGLPSNHGGYPPRVAFDAFGNAFLALIHDPGFLVDPHVELFVSTDGGETFAPVALPEIPGFEANVALAAGFGQVWLAFLGQAGPSFSVMTLAAPVSGPGAVGPFVQQTAPGSGGADSPDIALGQQGALIVYGKGRFTQAPGVAAQLDADFLGAGNFGPAVTIANVAGYPHLPRPRLAFDGGRAYVVFQDGLGDTGEDVALAFSDDGGVRWSAEIRVNDPVFSQDRLLPNVAAEAGRVAAAWYDFRTGSAVLRGSVLQGVTHPAEPAGPVDLEATPVSQSRIDLRWTDRSGNETGFRIRRERPPEVVEFTVGPNVTSFSDTGLLTDTSYAYTVVAFNGAGDSTSSNTVSATTLADPPAAPENLVATAVSFQRIDLSWDPAFDADFYEVQQSTDGTTFTTIRQATTTSIMIFELEPDTTYFFRVRAVNSGGPSPFSNVASARTGNVEPVAPSVLTATAVSSTRVDLAWRDNSTNETIFEVERAQGGNGFRLIATRPANTTSFSDTGARPGRTLTYRVRACNSIGCSSFSNTASATTPRR
jgi:fibronectin type 3 domain-containing protein